MGFGGGLEGISEVVEGWEVSVGRGHLEAGDDDDGAGDSGV